jgi:anthranilate synthase/aminodeoxychorismate synthase-like glutamine amidotransferase
MSAAGAGSGSGPAEPGRQLGDPGRGLRILVVDNYDSFVFNLVQYLGELGAETQVWRNDAGTVADVRALDPDGVVISPGPGHPRDARLSVDIVRDLGDSLPVLGVCLGHQVIGHVYGGRVGRAPELVHGKTSPIHHQGTGVLAGLPVPFAATRYHSLVVERDGLPEVLEVTGETAQGLIMALRHRSHPVEGVQFHPESILTDSGHQLLGNWLAGLRVRAAA